jgi:hypothetical protein
MRRNSDVHLETLLRKSSLVSSKAIGMLLDKASVAEERKYH